eukprot:GILK01001270.1.p1 GENE.GILK01001270.1~~GILK01001270.1.p1  ORF type:complete len:537 (+),score=122.83 GILK01001270.1:510-2120(+)
MLALTVKRGQPVEEDRNRPWEVRSKGDSEFSSFLLLSSSSSTTFDLLLLRVAVLLLPVVAVCVHSSSSSSSLPVSATALASSIGSLVGSESAQPEITTNVVPTTLTPSSDAMEVAQPVDGGLTSEQTEQPPQQPTEYTQPDGSQQQQQQQEADMRFVEPSIANGPTAQLAEKIQRRHQQEAEREAELTQTEKQLQSELETVEHALDKARNQETDNEEIRAFGSVLKQRDSADDLMTDMNPPPFEPAAKVLENEQHQSEFSSSSSGDSHWRITGGDTRILTSHSIEKPVLSVVHNHVQTIKSFSFRSVEKNANGIAQTYNNSNMPICPRSGLKPFRADPVPYACPEFAAASCCTKEEADSILTEMDEVWTNIADKRCLDAIRMFKCGLLCSPQMGDFVSIVNVSLDMSPTAVSYSLCGPFCDSFFELCRGVQLGSTSFGSVFESSRAFCSDFDLTQQSFTSSRNTFKTDVKVQSNVNATCYNPPGFVIKKKSRLWMWVLIGVGSTCLVAIIGGVVYWKKRRANQNADRTPLLTNNRR